LELEIIMFYLKNLPTWERLARTIAGAMAVVASLYVLSGTIAILAAASAAGIAMTGLVGFCPMCAMLGRRLDQQKK
jgi:hypothetical protein